MNQPLRVSNSQTSEEFQKLFLHRLRHDLLNTVRPLVEIPNWITEDLAEEGIEPTPALRQNLEMMTTYGSRLSGMLADLLTYAHVGLNSEENQSTLDEVVEASALGMLPDKFQLSTDFQSCSMPVSTPDLRVMVDALLSNSVKHHDRPMGRIHVVCKAQSGGVQLTVSDDGPGIEARFLEQVFDPLTTLESRDILEGSGMGLTIVRRIAQLSGGYVKAISTDGKRGTCIVVWFP